MIKSRSDKGKTLSQNVSNQPLLFYPFLNKSRSDKGKTLSQNVLINVPIKIVNPFNSWRHRKASLSPSQLDENCEAS